MRERLVGVGGEGAGGATNGGGLMNGGPLCHRCDGQLQPERAPMHRRWSVQCFEWPENIPPSSICIEEQKNHRRVHNLEQLWEVYCALQ